MVVRPILIKATNAVVLLAYMLNVWILLPKQNVPWYSFQTVSVLVVSTSPWCAAHLPSGRTIRKSIMVGIVIMQRRVRSPKRFYRARYAPFIHVYIVWSHVRGEILHDRVQSPSKHPSSASAFLGHQLSIAVNRAQLINSQLLGHDIRFIFGPVSSPLISFLKLKARLRLKVERLPGISMLKSMEDNCMSSPISGSLPHSR